MTRRTPPSTHSRSLLCRRIASPMVCSGDSSFSQSFFKRLRVARALSGTTPCSGPLQHTSDHCSITQYHSVLHIFSAYTYDYELVESFQCDHRRVSRHSNSALRASQFVAPIPLPNLHRHTIYYHQSSSGGVCAWPSKMSVARLGSTRCQWISTPEMNQHSDQWAYGEEHNATRALRLLTTRLQHMDEFPQRVISRSPVPFIKLINDDHAQAST